MEKYVWAISFSEHSAFTGNRKEGKEETWLLGVRFAQHLLVPIMPQKNICHRFLSWSTTWQMLFSWTFVKCYCRRYIFWYVVLTFCSVSSIHKINTICLLRHVQENVLQVTCRSCLLIKFPTMQLNQFKARLQNNKVSIRCPLFPEKGNMFCDWQHVLKLGMIATCKL